jgi:hypothetical protein
MILIHLRTATIRWMRDVNAAAIVANPIADQNANAGSLFTFTFAPNTFTDVDQGDVLSYSATLADGSALPTWLSFNAATRTFTGAGSNSLRSFAFYVLRFARV